METGGRLLRSQSCSRVTRVSGGPSKTPILLLIHFSRNCPEGTRDKLECDSQSRHTGENCSESLLRQIFLFGLLFLSFSCSALLISHALLSLSLSGAFFLCLSFSFTQSLPLPNSICPPFLSPSFLLSFSFYLSLSRFLSFLSYRVTNSIRLTSSLPLSHCLHSSRTTRARHHRQNNKEHGVTFA